MFLNINEEFNTQDVKLKESVVPKPVQNVGPLGEPFGSTVISKSYFLYFQTWNYNRYLIELDLKRLRLFSFQPFIF